MNTSQILHNQEHYLDNCIHLTYLTGGDVSENYKCLHEFINGYEDSFIFHNFTNLINSPESIQFRKMILMKLSLEHILMMPKF